MAERSYSCSKPWCAFCQEMERLEQLKNVEPKEAVIPALTTKYYRRKTRYLLKKSA